MDSAEAVRFVTLHFLETYKDNFDEDTYESAKTLIEATPKEKMIQRVTKVIKPFAEASQTGKLSKKTLLKDGWITDKCGLSSKEIKDMGKQAEMAYQLCSTINDMEPDKLKGIEQMASAIQSTIEGQLTNMSDEEKSKLNPADLVTGVMGQLGSMGVEGIDSDFSNVIGGLMGNILSPPEPDDRSRVKTSLMESYSKIDGNVQKRQ